MLAPLKYKLETGLNVITVDGGGAGSHLAFQHGELCLWTNAQTNKQPKVMQVYVALTGETVPYLDAEYLGTALNENGRFVLHAYRVEGTPS